MTPDTDSLDEYLAAVSNADHALAALLNNPDASRGTVHTPREVAQQPLLWRRTARRVQEQASELRLFLESAGVYASDNRAECIFTGAGSSDYVGRSIADLLRVRLQTSSTNWPTTRMTVAPESFLLQRQRYLVVHFSRSGNSPESTAVFNWVRKHRSDTARQLVVTCNRGGTLAGLAREHSRHAHLVVLDEAAHDEGLAMTSSFTSMVVAGQGLAYLDRLDKYIDVVDRAATAAEHIIDRHTDEIAALARRPIARVFYLGNNDLLGAATESALKGQELTAGEIVAGGEDTLAFRHGPISAVDSSTMVCFFLSSDPLIHRYESDVLEQFGETFGEMGAHTMTVGPRRPTASLPDDVVAITYGGTDIPPYFQAAPAVLVGQLFGLFAAADRGYHVDDPSQDKALYSRTVQGVKLYAE